MARPKPAGPSKRVYVSFGVAALLGAVVFLIWWFTSATDRPQAGTPQPIPPVETAPPASAVLTEAGLPRGGRLTGSTGSPELSVQWLTAAPLVRVHRGTDRVEPWLAESWAASADHLIYTLRLRDGVTSAGGIPLTAELAVAALTAVQAAGQPVVARAVDPRTVEIRFAQPFAPALRVLDRHPLPGFGPFVEKGKGVFVRNPHYWRTEPDGSPLPLVDEIALTPARPAFEDFGEAPVLVDDYEALKKVELAGNARLFELGPGLDADALWFAPAFAPSALRRGGPGEVDSSGRRGEAAGTDSSRRIGETAQADKPWLTDERFRLAVSTAVDRAEYCRQVFYGACDPIAGPVTPGNMAWFNPDLPIGRPDRDLARAMLADLGLRDRSGDGMLNDATRRPVRFSLLIRRDVPTSARAAAFLTDALKGIGVRVDVVPVSAAELAARRATGNYEAVYDRIEMSDTDPAMNLGFWLSSGDAHVWHGARRGPPADWERQIDQLMRKNASSVDRVERLQAFVDVQKIYYQHMPAIFFGAPYVRIMTSIRTLNARPSPLRPHLLWNAEALAALK